MTFLLSFQCDISKKFRQCKINKLDISPEQCDELLAEAKQIHHDNAVNHLNYAFALTSKTMAHESKEIMRLTSSLRNLKAHKEDLTNPTYIATIADDTTKMQKIALVSDFKKVASMVVGGLLRVAAFALQTYSAINLGVGIATAIFGGAGIPLILKSVIGLAMSTAMEKYGKKLWKEGANFDKAFITRNTILKNKSLFTFSNKLNPPKEQSIDLPSTPSSKSSSNKY